MSLTLHGFFRSSAAFRVRIALNLKGLPHEQVSVNLFAGAQHEPAYRAINPQGIVPSLVDGDAVLNQSLAILEYLEERFPQPPLLPTDAAARARVRAMALNVACEIHPLASLKPQSYLEREFGASQAQRDDWARYWMGRGFEAFEARLAGHPQTGSFCHGDTPTFADLCLVPQMFNARLLQLDLSPYPTMVRIEQSCLALPAFEQALPANQPDAV
jgi:maleylacetoacetate isomerase